MYCSSDNSVFLTYRRQSEEPSSGYSTPVHFVVAKVTCIIIDEINTELLINQVEDKPAIWDKTLDSYKDKKLKESAWKEMCVMLKENFEELEQKRRQ